MANINRLKSQQIDFNNNEFTIDGEKLKKILEKTFSKFRPDRNNSFIFY